jgi:hypothetical protein
MWADTLKLEEVEGTLRAAKSLATVEWASPVLKQANAALRKLELGVVDLDAYRANPVAAAESSFLFEVRFAAALARVGFSAAYEHKAGVGDSSVDFKICSDPTWLAELVSLHETDAFKAATWNNDAFFGYMLSDNADDPRQSTAGEMIKAQERIGEKVFDRKRREPIKFPVPSDSLHMLVVDARGYGGDGQGDRADWWQIAIGPDGLGSELIQVWTNPTDQSTTPVRGLFEPQCPLSAARVIQERIHFIAFVCEQKYCADEIQNCSYYLANRSLFADENAAKDAFSSWPLKRL